MPQHELRNLRVDAARRALADLPEEHDPSSFAEEAELVGHQQSVPETEEIGGTQMTRGEKVGHMLDLARTTPELPEEETREEVTTSADALKARREAAAATALAPTSAFIEPDRPRFSTLISNFSDQWAQDILAMDDSVRSAASSSNWDDDTTKAVHTLSSMLARETGADVRLIDWSDELVREGDRVVPRETVFEDAGGVRYAMDADGTWVELT